MNVNFFNNQFRSVMWLIFKMIAFITGKLWGAILTVSTINPLDNPSVGSWYNYMLMISVPFITLFFLIKLVSHYFAEEIKIDILSIAKRLILIVIVLISVRPTFDMVYNLNNAIVKALPQMIGQEVASAENNNIVMTAIINGSLDESSSESKREEFLETWNNDAFDINDTTYGEYDYQVEFGVLLFGTILFAIGLIFTVFQIVKRVFSIGFYFIIAPFPIGTLIVEGGKTFQTWFQTVLGLFLGNWVQLLALLFSVSMLVWLPSLGLGITVSLFLTLGTILFTVDSPSNIQQLIGQNVSMSQTANDFRSMAMLGQASQSAIGLANLGMGVAGMTTMGAGRGIVAGSSAGMKEIGSVASDWKKDDFKTAMKNSSYRLGDKAIQVESGVNNAISNLPNTIDKVNKNMVNRGLNSIGRRPMNYQQQYPFDNNSTGGECIDV